MCQRALIYPDLVTAPDKDRLLQRMFSDHLDNVFRQRPSVYLAYIVKIIGVRDDPSFLDYYEIAATRDLIVHNNCVVNALYIEKAGKKARAALGEKVEVNQDYFDGVIAKLKKVSGAIKRDVEKKYGAAEGTA